MRVVDIIDKKKKNKELTKAEIEFLLDGYLKVKLVSSSFVILLK